MKKNPFRPHFLLLITLLLAACKPDPIVITRDQICHQGGSSEKTCLPLDNRNAVAITHKNGKAHLISVPAEEVGETDSIGFMALGSELLASGHGILFDPQSMTLEHADGGIRIRSTGKSSLPVMQWTQSELSNASLFVIPSTLGLVIADARKTNDAPQWQDATREIHGPLSLNLPVFSASKTCQQDLISQGLGMVVIIDDGTSHDRFRQWGPLSDYLHSRIFSRPDQSFRPQSSPLYLHFKRLNFGRQEDLKHAGMNGLATKSDIPECDAYCDRILFGQFDFDDNVRILKKTFTSEGQSYLTYAFLNRQDTLGKLPLKIPYTLTFFSRIGDKYKVEVCKSCYPFLPYFDWNRFNWPSGI